MKQATKSRFLPCGTQIAVVVPVSPELANKTLQLSVQPLDGRNTSHARRGIARDLQLARTVPRQRS
jgi:hypothetical protein